MQQSSHGTVSVTLLLIALVGALRNGSPPQPARARPASIAPAVLKSLSLEELSQIEVTTPSKQPVKAFQTSSAIYVITGEDIRRSGATSIPAALRTRPGRGGRANRCQQVVDRHSRVRQQADPIRSRADRRPHGLHTVV